MSYELRNLVSDHFPEVRGGLMCLLASPGLPTPLAALRAAVGDDATSSTSPQSAKAAPHPTARSGTLNFAMDARGADALINYSEIGAHATLGSAVGPRWEGNQRAEYVRALTTACETRARSLGLDVLARNLDLGPESGSIFERAAQAAVRQLPAALERTYFRDSWGRDQCERLAKDCPALRYRESGFTFSDEPTAGQYLAWQCFKASFSAYYQPHIMAAMRRMEAKLMAERKEKQRLKKEELRTSLARGVAAWSLADLKADCKLLDLKVRRWRRAPRHRCETGVVRAQVSGNKGQLFDRLRGYVDGTVHPKKRRRF